MFCTKCGNSLTEGSKFCTKCGAPVAGEAPAPAAAPVDAAGKPCVYDLNGVRGRHLTVFEDKVVLSVKATLGSFLTGNITDGEKTIYFVDCIGIQYKASGFAIGYLQFETAGGIMNNKASNFFNENTFTWDSTVQSNDRMTEVANYCKKRIDEFKNARNNPAAAPAYSAADELIKFKSLLDAGVITQEEFDQKKKQLLGF